MQSDVTPPTVPGEFKAKDSLYRAELSWTESTDTVLPATGVAGYYVYRNTTATVPADPYTTLGPLATSLLDEIGWKATYYYCVQAFDGAGNLSADDVVDQGDYRRCGEVGLHRPCSAGHRLRAGVLLPNGLLEHLQSHGHQREEDP